jgi:hypothetical protein
MQSRQGFQHEQITERYLAIFARIRPDLCLPLRRYFLASLLPITIPGSIIGMLILFVLLALQVLPAKWVNPGCYVLIRYMALLFVPIGVGSCSTLTCSRTIWSDSGVLYHQYAGGFPGGELELAHCAR